MPCSNADWCASISDRFAATLVNAATPHTYAGGAGAPRPCGLIFRMEPSGYSSAIARYTLLPAATRHSPSTLTQLCPHAYVACFRRYNRALCSYSKDGGSNSITCRTRNSIAGGGGASSGNHDHHQMPAPPPPPRPPPPPSASHSASGESCVPGCYHGLTYSWLHERWCAQDAQVLAQGCPFRPTALTDMMRYQLDTNPTTYNEVCAMQCLHSRQVSMRPAGARARYRFVCVKSAHMCGPLQVVIDSAVYAAHLPQSLEAFFMVREDSFVRQTHAAFLRAYPELTSADVPLVLYEERSGFTDVSRR